MTAERYNEIVAKLNEFLAKHGRDIQCWYFQEIDWTNGLINHGQGPYQNNHGEQQVQADITAFLAESGLTAREMWDWGHKAAEEAGRRTEEAMAKSEAEYNRQVYSFSDDFDPYPCDGMGH